MDVVVRADSNRIEDEAHILAHFGINRDNLLASGTEAKVYTFNTATVLKVYGKSPGLLERLESLKWFYENLIRWDLSLKAPF